jgi:hypothetical protein
VRGISVTALSGSKTPFAFALVEDRWLVLGTTPEAVAALVVARDREDPSEFSRVRAAEFPESETFAFVDLKAVTAWADMHRPALARRLAKGKGASDASAARDLDEALALFRLFRAGFAVSRIEPDYSSAHRTLGLLSRDPLPQP